MKWGNKKESLQLLKKFLSNGRICLYSSQPNVGSHIRPSLPPAPPPPDIELADALLLLLFTPRTFIQRNVVVGPAIQ